MSRRKNETDNPIVQSPSCPRCGYDLTGVVESWVEQCPVEGVCSECGLEFAWCDLLVESRRKIPWLYEHCNGLAAGYAIEMVPRALLARRFWRKVQLHHRPNVARLILFPFVAFFVLWFGSMALGASSLCVRYLLFGSKASIQSYSFEDDLGFLAFSQFGYAYEFSYGFSESGYDIAPLFEIVSTVGFSAGMVLSILIARSSRRMSKVSAAHVLRAFSYGLSVSILIYGLYALLWTTDRIGIDDNGSLQDEYDYYSWGYASVWGMIRVIAWHWYMNWWTMSAAPMFWLMIWWWCAFRYGFRLEQWMQVFVAGIFLGFLLATSTLLLHGVWLSMMY